MTTPTDPDAAGYERPAPPQRRVVSVAVEVAIERIAAIARPEVAEVFERALPMTLDTAVTLRELEGKPDAFVITGDIPAMWPRDAMNAVWPYLSLMGSDPTLRAVVEGVLRREVACIRLDPYANAFYDFLFPPDLRDQVSPKFGIHAGDHTVMRPEIHERKYELDTLAALLRLSVGYHEAGGDPAVFDDDWCEAIRLIAHTIGRQQAGSDEEDADPGGPPYTFERTTRRASDTLVLRGRGQPAKRCGLSKSPFRPSDDAAHLPFHIPANAMASVGLTGVAALMRELHLDAPLAGDCERLGRELRDAIERVGVVGHPQAGRVYAYEVDGFGNAYFMDDANVPSLLSLPYLGYCDRKDPTYRRTRALVWSDHNPYFTRGRAAEGIGGPHIGCNYIWPMSLLMFALTADDEAEIDRALRAVVSTHAGRWVMHESFNRHNPDDFTRPWFCWPNALLAELVLKLSYSQPHLLGQGCGPRPPS